MCTITNEEIITNNYRIITQFELLKYIGGKNEEKQASGEGIPIDIILLPDLVLDIRRYNLDNTEIKQKCIAIGGRSGRVACILAHLTEFDDGFYRPHLIAKTGNLGKLLLENEFYSKQNINDSRKLISYITVREREPRVTVWNDSKDDFESRRSFTENEINSEEIKQNEFLRKVIKRSRVIYFSSIKSPNFENILDYLVEELVNTSVKIYIDCTRSKEDHLNDLKKLIFRQDFENNIEGIIMSTNERKILEKCWKGFEIDLKRKHISIVFYSNNKIEYFDKEGIRAHSIDVDISFDNEDIPERFKAGFMLAKSIYETTINLSNEVTTEQKDFNNELINFCSDFWKDDPIRKMILFGLGIAKAKSNDYGYCDLKSIFKEREDLYPTHRGSLEFKSLNIIRNSKHLVTKDVDITSLNRISGYRRNNKLSDMENFKRDHKNCIIREDCKYHNLSKPDQQEIKPYRAIMLDLDGTLLDSSIERKRGLSSALNIINLHFGISNNSIIFFEKYVYDYWPLFKALGKGDFRQEWNLKGWYIVYILFWLEYDHDKDKGLLAIIQNDYTKIPNPDRNPDGINDLIKNSQWKNRFDDIYNQIADNHGDIIEKAMQEFSNIKLFAFKEAFDFLKSLQDSGMYNLYIVSEGNSETQWLKLKSTGLSDFFPRERVLTTDDAGNLNKQKDRLRREKEIVENKLDEIKSKLHSSKKSYTSFSKFKQSFSTELFRKITKVSSKMSSEIEKIWFEGTTKFEKTQFTIKNAQIKNDNELYINRQQTILFIEELLKRLSTKGGITFYAAAIRAILNNPESPLDSLRDFEKLINTEPPDSPYRIAMIGDRQKNDIEPVIKLLERKRSLTMRLLSGKYYAKEPFQKAEYESFDPDYIIHTLAQAKALLLSDKIWENKVCTYDTPFYCLKIEFDERKRKFSPSENEIINPESVSVSVGLDIILTGIQMPSIFPLTNKICRQILREFILLKQEVGLKPILDEIGLFDVLNKEIRVLLRKTRLLTSLIIDTKLQHNDLLKYKSQLRTRLEESRNFIINENIDPIELTYIENALNIIQNV